MKKTIKMALSTAVLLMAFAASALAEDDPWNGPLWITCRKCGETGLYQYADDLFHAGIDEFGEIQQWYSLDPGWYTYCYHRAHVMALQIKTYLSVPTCTEAGLLFQKMKRKASIRTAAISIPRFTPFLRSSSLISVLGTGVMTSSRVIS